MTVELYEMDCALLMQKMPDKSVDLVLTDPPYGIGGVWKGGSSHGWSNARKDTPHRNSWDEKPPSDFVFQEIMRVAKKAVIWGGNYFALPQRRGWLVWNKPERGFSLSEAELAWTSEDFPIRVFDHHRSDNFRVHPTQKPLQLMIWCMEVMKTPKNAVVFDPFAGSGTTGVACIQSGRNFIGAEIDHEYFDLMQKRIELAKQQTTIFDMESE